MNKHSSDGAEVFIVGEARSGTSLLYRMLQLHSSFRPTRCESAAGVDLTESKVFERATQLERSNALEFMLNDRSRYDAFDRETRWPRRAVRLAARQPLQWPKRWARQAFLEPSLRRYFEHARIARGARRLVEKSPSNVTRVDLIRRCFPDCRLLYVVRHPLDVYSSYARRRAVTATLDDSVGPRGWLDISAADFAERYRTRTQRGLAEAARADFLLIRYEDLVAEPRITIERVLTFLGEPFEAQCVPADETNKQDWAVDPHLFDSVRRDTKQWCDYVRPEEGAEIERLLDDCMQRLDYEPKAARVPLRA